MDRDNQYLALFNILEIIPWIDNIENDVDGLLIETLVRLYEGNVAALDGSNMDIALYNILHVVPLIDNIGDDVDGLLNQTFLRIYERNVDALHGYVQEP